MALSIPRVPEPQRRPGIHYALTDDGIELPVVDVTHPAFAFEPTDAEVAVQVASFVRDARRRERLPRFLRTLFFRVVLRESILARGLMRAGGSFLSGMDTYLFKIGPDLLGAGYARPIDRRIAAALPGASMRLRLLDMARLLVEGLTPLLVARSSPLHLVNLGGGPSSDSWNALLLLKKDWPELVAGRAVSILTLDCDAAGPSFAARAIAVLRETGAPLHGLGVTFRHVPYDWAEPEILPKFLGSLAGEAPIVAVSSEGALLEYASDPVVAANLRALRDLTPADAVLVGSATGDDEVAALAHRDSAIRLQPRSVEALGALVGGAGWKVARMVQRPMCRNVLLVKR
jgi:hypothetical protein